MSNPFLAQVVIFAGNFAPRGWSLCEGQLLPINQNSALFSLLGTIYGGDGRTTFALPELRGRAPIHPGTGPGLPTYRQGAKGGRATTTLTLAEMPTHNHTVTIQANSAMAEEDSPNNHYLAQGDFYHSAPSANVSLAAPTVSNVGGGQSFNSMPPYLAINYIIAMQGTFPSRS